ncbi:unnamed protein product, partial [Rotaria sordida]
CVHFNNVDWYYN